MWYWIFGWILIFLIPGIPLILLYANLYFTKRAGRSWLLSIGKVAQKSKEGDSVRQFLDPDIERVDLKDFKIDRQRFYRMRVHLDSDSGMSFELAGKKIHVGKVYEPGEGVTGIDVVDRRYRVESPDMKSTVMVLGAPNVQKALNEVRGVRSVHVMGDEIEIVFDFRNKLLDPIYDFVRELTQELMVL